jgi:hypothetical protein
MDMKYGTKCELKDPVCEFVDGITDFSNNITFLDKSTTKLRVLVAGISNVSGPGQIEGGISALDGMVTACGAVNQNPLLRTTEEKGYYFCPKVAYDLGSLSSLKSELVDLKNKYSLFIQPNTEAESIAKESQRRIHMRQNLDACSESVNYSSSALAGIRNSNHPAANYSEVREKNAKMDDDAKLIASLCRDRKFSEVEGAINTFKNDEAAARATLANVSAEYDSVRQLYDKVFSDVSSLPPEKNASAILESMRMVQRELGMVQNVSDLAVLRGVLLENERKAKELTKPVPWSVDWNTVALALAGALTITGALYFIMKRTRRRGL